MNEESKKVAGEGEKDEPPGRVQQFLVEYGITGIIVLLSISALTYAGFFFAFYFGFQVEGAGETTGVFVAAGAGWLLSKPIRIPVAIMLTPVVVQVVRRVRGRTSTETDSA